QLKQAQKMESLGHLTGGVAHDFNNLLAVILGNSEILCDEIEDPALKEIAELVMTSAEKGADLTQRLLAFGRRQLLNPQNVDLSQMVRSLSQTVGRTIGSQVTIETRSEAERPAFVDRALCETALLNLVLNARDAMPDGGVVTIAVDTVKTGDSSSQFLLPGEYVRVSVSDTGLGMAKEVLERAFDPFFTTKNVGRGAGMGLSMVYGFAKQSGGHVTIESQVGRGTIVRMYLPTPQENVTPQDDAYEAATEWEAETSATGGSERILIVEDEPQLRAFVSRQLSGLGYEVLEAEGGAPALDILRAEKNIDLLFTDLIMPGGMSGFDLVEQARAFRPQLPVLLTTGYAGETDDITAKIKEPILKKPYKK
ncbi:MAG: ATP-binding protein, partial [Pseudomonadales bacterium]|nr:ATP-binding protein [Pseudomonadales bacterium]